MSSPCSCLSFLSVSMCFHCPQNCIRPVYPLILPLSIFSFSLHLFIRIREMSLIIHFPLNFISLNLRHPPCSQWKNKNENLFHFSFSYSHLFLNILGLVLLPTPDSAEKRKCAFHSSSVFFDFFLSFLFISKTIYFPSTFNINFFHYTLFSNLFQNFFSLPFVTTVNKY